MSLIKQRTWNLALLDRLTWELEGEQRAIDDRDWARVNLHKRSIRQILVSLGDEGKQFVTSYRALAQGSRAAERKDNRR